MPTWAAVFVTYKYESDHFHRVQKTIYLNLNNRDTIEGILYRDDMRGFLIEAVVFLGRFRQ